MKYTLYCISILCFGITYAMEQSPVCTIAECTITEQTIRTNKEKFISYLDQKNKEYHILQEWTDPNSWLGSLISTAIEWASPWTRYGKIEPEKTKIFLGRAFEKQESLNEAIDHIATSKESIQYLNTVISAMTQEGLRRKDLAQLAEIMKKNKHPHISETDKMGSKDEQNQYIIPDDQFYSFAATNLFAVYLVENQPFKKQNGLSKHKKY